MRYLWPILGLGALCAAWVLFQLWLRRVDPGGANLKRRCGNCGRDCDDRG